MSLILENPSKLRLDGYVSRRKEVETLLTYTDRTKLHELARLKKSRYLAEKYGEVKYKEEQERLKAESKVCLLKEDENGFWTYPGLAQRLSRHFNDVVINNVSYPEAGLVPWARMPDGEDRYYQKLMHDNLLEVRHGSVQVGTGLGKSRVIRNLSKTLSLKTVVLAPTLSIAEQLHDDFVQHLGRNRVGFFGDGSKVSNRLFTVGTYQSFARIQPGSKEWENLKQTQTFIVDESHLTPAATLKQVCEGLCGQAPYRFFFSGTQMRNDGAGMLLEGIIGPIVYEMSVERGVNEGFLSKPNFVMVEMQSPSNYIVGDPDKMAERHFYANKQVYARAAEIANKSVGLLGHQVLILIEEVSQFQYLLPYLRYSPGFAHGGVTKANRGSVPEMYHKSNPKELVEQLNRGELPILVGTSCISIGTDIRTPKTVINLQGGTSEPKIRQAVGRGTRRLNGVKEEFNYWDFCVKVRHPEDPEYVANVHRHAIERARIYRDIYPSFRIVR
ncbi:helicase [Myxococcus phage Mx1]|nr:helicase [Myxococcus phage Mx1]